MVAWRAVLEMDGADVLSAAPLQAGIGHPHLQMHAMAITTAMRDLASNRETADVRPRIKPDDFGKACTM